MPQDKVDVVKESVAALTKVETILKTLHGSNYKNLKIDEMLTLLKKEIPHARHHDLLNEIKACQIGQLYEPEKAYPKTVLEAAQSVQELTEIIKQSIKTDLKCIENAIYETDFFQPVFGRKFRR